MRYEVAADTAACRFASAVTLAACAGSAITVSSCFAGASTAWPRRYAPMPMPAAAQTTIRKFEIRITGRRLVPSCVRKNPHSGDPPAAQNPHHDADAVDGAASDPKSAEVHHGVQVGHCRRPPVDGGGYPNGAGR